MNKEKIIGYVNSIESTNKEINTLFDRIKTLQDYNGRLIVAIITEMRNEE